MKRWILLLGLALSAALAMSAPPEPPPPAASGATAAALLDTLVLHSRRSATLQSGRLAGPGADLIRELAAPAQFVLFGEAHANSGIADVATALWAELRPLGFRHAAVEVDPWAAAALESELRLGGVAAWNRFLAARGGIIAVPFFSWSPEVRFAEAVLRDGGSLWGLDQVFIGAGAWLLRDLAASASDPQARVQAEALAAEADGKLQWLGQVDVQRLQALRNRLQSPADAAGRQLLDAMIESAAIYKPFSGGGGEATLANERRETGMKRLFREHLRRDEQAKVLLKFGGNHLYRGTSPTLVQALGGFVGELATERGTQTLSLLVLCGPGSQAAGLDAKAEPCDDLAADGDWRQIAPFVSAETLTVFDLRAWRLRPRRLAVLPAEVQRIAGAYDLLVFVPRAPASAFLPGLKALGAP